jgi:hypothetical protein
MERWGWEYERRCGGSKELTGSPEAATSPATREYAGESERLCVQGDTNRREEGQKWKLAKFCNVKKVGLQIQNILY